MNEPYKISFLSISVVVFLLPIFFLTSSIVPFSISKIAFLSIGSIIIFISFIYETLKQGRLTLPSTYLLWGVIVIPVIYFISSIQGVSPNLSLFGYNLEIGTFVSITVMFALLTVISIVLKDALRIMKVYGALLLSLALVLVFGLVKVISEGSLFNFGVFSGVMGNPIGGWTDYAIFFGFLTIVSLFATVMLPLGKLHRSLMYVATLLSVFLLSVINFSTAWQLVFGASILSLVYFITVERRIHGTNSSHEIDYKKLTPSIIVLIVSLIFVFNPTISATNGKLGDYISSSFGVANVDVRPSLSSTMGVAGTTLKSHALLGSGPNTFAQDWLMYKPSVINLTGFWNTPFPYGFGFLPTQIATTGILGTLAWGLFLSLLLLLGIKALVKNSQIKSERFILVSSFIGSLFLWIAIFVYVPSVVILALTFILTGIFIASSRVVGLIPEKEFIFSKNLIWNFGSAMGAVLLGIGIAGLGLLTYQKVASARYFSNALTLTNTAGSSIETIEAELGKASELGPQDIYYSALSQLEFARAQSVLTSTVEKPEVSRATFETAISRSIAGAQKAAELNPNNYQNWIALGSIYAALVPKPFSVVGAYASAKSAYEKADKLNPLSPEVSLLKARLELDNGNPVEARRHIEQSIQKKQDYAEAYFLLTQLEIGENHINEAIKSAETASILSPNNAGIFFELGLLKYSNRDFAGAADAFSRSLAILPDYANAKYYLGLSLDLLNRRSEAVTLFEDLAKTNPDNQSVLQILSNLKAGNSAFFQSVNTSRPTSRTTPPIPTTTAPGQ